jgi:hypothetical protein
VEWSANIPDNYGGSLVSRVLGVLLKALAAKVGHKLHQFPGDEVNKENSISEAPETIQVIDVKELNEWTDKAPFEGGGGGSPVSEQILFRYSSAAEEDAKRKQIRRPLGLKDLPSGGSVTGREGSSPVNNSRSPPANTATTDRNTRPGRTLTKGVHSRGPNIVRLSGSEGPQEVKPNQVVIARQKSTSGTDSTPVAGTMA